MKVINPNEYGSLLFDEKENLAIENVMKSKRIFRYSKTEFPYVNMFEEKVVELLNIKHCLGVVNGTAGLIASLKAIGIKPNDRVLVSSFTFLATALAVIQCDGIPIPLELDLKTGVDFSDLQQEISKGCKAVIITHLQGRCFNLKNLAMYLKDKNIFLIEDACQAFASKCNEQYAGTYGDIGVFSFQQYKQISSGEGGAIVTNNSKLYTLIRNYCDMGSVRNGYPNWDSEDCMFGENYRMSNITGAILFEQMNKLNYILKKQKHSRLRIMQSIKSFSIDSIINSEDITGDTNMNIILFLDNSLKFEEVVDIAKEKYNIEMRKMWKGMYFENELFKKSKLTDLDVKNSICRKTKEIINRMAVISIPPILNKKSENLIIQLINEISDMSEKYKGANNG